MQYNENLNCLLKDCSMPVADCFSTVYMTVYALENITVVWKEKMYSHLKTVGFGVSDIEENLISGMS